MRADSLRPSLPVPPGARRLGGLLGSVLVGQAVNVALRLSGDDAPDLSPLEGCRLRLEVSDAPVRLTWRVRDGRLSSVLADAGPDADEVRIGGPIASFVRLALRVEDADTLFFQRRLSLEGDTEAALYLRNALDAAEPPAPAVLAPLLDCLRERLRAR